MTVERKRKRYLLLCSSAPIDEESKKELTRLILSRYPLEAKRLVWLERGLIVRTDVVQLEEMKRGLALRVGEVELATKSVSGSISKLKKMAKEGGC